MPLGQRFLIKHIQGGAGGVGLFRSEFLFLQKSPDLPDEEDGEPALTVRALLPWIWAAVALLIAVTIVNRVRRSISAPQKS